ncbi:PAS domain-containing sensor histidine kinase [Rhodoferax saidenbachensis]|uniref:histidine kinase n=1 Tax=Rhodoferax saidenbachensis TaxID=1484693 RepID=A0A1P8KFX3_9BURK|nr:PAS domain-containing sensor histidine kinase [Rhodoferax saidenbachensis]
MLDTSPDPTEDPRELTRLWRGFMTARLTLGLVLVMLQLALYITGTAHNQWLIAVSAAYFAGTVATRLLTSPKPLGSAFNRNWLMLVGLDVLTFASLQWMQGSNLNYTPLFALPILLAAVLGSLRMALGTAASVTMLLLGGTLWTYLGSPMDATPYFVQAALSGVGYFAIALLANQLSARLADEGQRARRSQVAARIQRQVNELVIESLPDGVLIVDTAGSVRAANPAARQLLGSRRAQQSTGFGLRDEPGWRPLLDLTRMSVGTGHNQEADVSIRHEGHGPRRLRARTRLAAPQGTDGESLCVLFLQDLRELEARMRTEKLASMGRMSTAVAHEIRNPLAAIAQANALLDEDLSDPRLKRLTGMVSQNAKRLEKIVEDILNVSRVQPLEDIHAAPLVHINESVHRICHDWAMQNNAQQQLATQLPDTESAVPFDADHLRRVLINLLDNARRYASSQPDAIQVGVRTTESQQARLTIWSDGAPMDRSVERHLFEPFFSSESRSSGLGLYICRELCESHGATILYQRNVRPTRGQVVEGNEFVIGFANTPSNDTQPANLNTTPWQTTLY